MRLGRIWVSADPQPGELRASGGSWEDEVVSEHELLIRHAAAWAGTKKRDLDLDLLETALHLRSFHDEEPATHWPAGSVEHLMLARWPSHGRDAPDADRLATTLDTFARFLRATGRMASGSAEPKALAKEASRAAPRMADACAAIGAHSQAKSLGLFGREIGIDLESAGSMEELQDSLQQVMEAWNALPQEERVARMPLTSPVPGVRAAALTDGLNDWLGDDGFDDDWEFDDLADSADSDEVDEWLDAFGDKPIEPGDPKAAAEQARRSPYVRSVLRLVEWLAPSKQVTKIGVLRLAPAKQAYEDLQLWRWQLGADALWGDLAGYGGDAGTSQDRARDAAGPGVDTDEDRETKARLERLFWWRSAADAMPLERLWLPAEQAGLTEIRATVARPAEYALETDEDWVTKACMLLLGLWSVADRSFIPRTVILGLIGSCMLEGSVTRPALVEMWEQHPSNVWMILSGPSLPELDHALREQAARHSGLALEQALHFFEDTGIWRCESDVFELTDLGRSFGGVLFMALDNGLIEL